MQNHKTKKVKLDGKDINIDVKLAPLIELMWEQDIETCQCCEEYRPGEACIEFPSTGEVMEFLDMVQRPYRVELETLDEGKGGRHAFVVKLLVFFPTEDIPTLVKRFQALSNT
jgi:hypothetical protein